MTTTPIHALPRLLLARARTGIDIAVADEVYGVGTWRYLVEQRLAYVSGRTLWARVTDVASVTTETWLTPD